VQKYTLVLTMLVENQTGNQKKNKCEEESKWCQMHTGPYSAGIEQVWYLKEKKILAEIKVVKNTHWSLQCWYRTSVEFS